MTYEESVEEFGADQTHDRECRTWDGPQWNWAGACNCTFSSRFNIFTP